MLTEKEWSSLSRRAAYRRDLSLWKKGGVCATPWCGSEAVYAISWDLDWGIGHFLIVCERHAGLRPEDAYDPTTETQYERMR